MRRIPISSSSRPHGITLVEVIISVTIILAVTVGAVQILQSNTRATVLRLKRIQASQYWDAIQNHLSHSNISTLETYYLQFPQIVKEPGYSTEVYIRPAGFDLSRRATISVRWEPISPENTITGDVTLIPK